MSAYNESLHKIVAVFHDRRKHEPRVAVPKRETVGALGEICVPAVGDSNAAQMALRQIIGCSDKGAAACTNSTARAQDSGASQSLALA